MNRHACKEDTGEQWIQVAINTLKPMIFSFPTTSPTVIRSLHLPLFCHWMRLCVLYSLILCVKRNISTLSRSAIFHIFFSLASSTIFHFCKFSCCCSKSNKICITTSTAITEKQHRKFIEPHSFSTDFKRDSILWTNITC